MRFLGAGAAGAPLLAKSPAALAGIDGGMGIGVRTAMENSGSAAGSGGIDGGTTWVHPSIARSNYLKLVGKLPGFVEEQLREQAKYISTLDPDIAVLRSFSLNAKVAWQRERNYERLIATAHRQGPWETAMQAFEKVAGFRWSLW